MTETDFYILAIIASVFLIVLTIVNFKDRDIWFAYASRATGVVSVVVIVVSVLNILMSIWSLLR